MAAIVAAGLLFTAAHFPVISTLKAFCDHVGQMVPFLTFFLERWDRTYLFTINTIFASLLPIRVLYGASGENRDIVCI
jgi:hypothetical protein